MSLQEETSLYWAIVTLATAQQGGGRCTDERESGKGGGEVAFRSTSGGVGDLLSVGAANAGILAQARGSTAEESRGILCSRRGGSREAQGNAQGALTTS